MSATLRRRILTVAALASAPLMVQYPALAAQASVTVAQSAVPSIAPGASGRVTLAEANTGPEASFSTLAFTAPAGTTFADTNLYFDNEQVKYVSCALSDSDATMTCTADAALVFPADSTTQVGVDVRVPADAAAAATLGGGSMSVPSVDAGTAWSFAVSTALNGSAGADAANPSNAANTLNAANTSNAVAATKALAAAKPALAKGLAADPVPGDPDGDDGSNLVRPWGSEDHPPQHCLCGQQQQQTYLVKIIAGEYIRSGPGTNYTIVGSLPAGAVVGVTCKRDGTIVDGNPRWYLLSSQPGWISARWAQDLTGVPPFC